jgi:hypothetical protein
MSSIAPLLSHYFPLILLLILKETVTGYDLSEKTSSETTLGLASHWVSSCSKTHEACQYDPVETRSRYLPTRLVEINSTEDCVLRISIDLPPSTPYLSLSHCWGGGIPFRLLSSNVEKLREKIEVSNLPSIFQDALTVTESLGFSHIWIDSLCII